MIGRRVVNSVAGVLLATALMYVGACGSSDDSPAQGEGTSDVIYEGGATDEALDVLLATTDRATNRRTRFLAPLDGASVSASAAPTFQWELGNGENGRWRGRRGSRVREALALFGGERAAYAHGAPVNGTAYLLELTKNGERLVRVFTTNTTYVPADAAWAALEGAGGPIRATVTAGIFDTNALAADGGPFDGDPVTFEVVP